MRWVLRPAVAPSPFFCFPGVHDVGEWEEARRRRRGRNEEETPVQWESNEKKNSGSGKPWQNACSPPQALRYSSFRISLPLYLLFYIDQMRCGLESSPAGVSVTTGQALSFPSSRRSERGENKTKNSCSRQFALAAQFYGWNTDDTASHPMAALILLISVVCVAPGLLLAGTQTGSSYFFATFLTCS